VPTGQGTDLQRSAVVVRPPERWPGLGFRELWAHRELFWLLLCRDLKLRYRQTLLGVTWVILQPVMAIAVFAVVLGRLVRVPSDGIPYPLFAYAGLLPWMFFASAVTTGTASLVGSSNLLTKVYFPRIVLPAAAATARLVDFAVGSIGIVALLAFYRVPVTPVLLFLPLAVAIELLLAIGLSALLASFNVKYRDVGFVVPVILQLGMFATPVLYRWTLVPPRWRWVVMANPLTGIVEGYRSALLGMDMPWKPLTVSVVAAFMVAAAAVVEIRRVEGALADIV
jgi:lipopolysaccharide transport system permease protein